VLASAGEEVGEEQGGVAQSLAALAVDSDDGRSVGS
jgi:hypothetical protein